MRYISILLICLLLVVGCGQATQGEPSPQPTQATQGDATSIPNLEAVAPTGAVGQAEKVIFGLDWTPNTNHTGVYVARDRGWYTENGLTVEIVPPPEGSAVEQLIASGQIDIGISFQEAVTQGRAQGLPLVSIAAVIQHNTSGFASRKELGITSPKDFENKKFGAYGSPFEKAVIEGLMGCVGADASKVEFVDIGSSDLLVATERGQVDFVWIYQGWQGVQAELAGVGLNVIMLNDLKCIPDYYTPVIVTSERMIAERPEVLRRFLKATSLGYTFAISNPAEAGDILVKAAPELDAKLVQASQRYLASQYQAEAVRWGEQRADVWSAYAQWMADRELIPQMIEPEKAFTNAFLP